MVYQKCHLPKYIKDNKSNACKRRRKSILEKYSFHAFEFRSLHVLEGTQRVLITSGKERNPTHCK